MKQIHVYTITLSIKLTPSYIQASVISKTILLFAVVNISHVLLISASCTRSHVTKPKQNIIRSLKHIQFSSSTEYFHLKYMCFCLISFLLVFFSPDKTERRNNSYVTAIECLSRKTGSSMAANMAASGYFQITSR